MEDLVLERIKRLHGDFLDPDGEYDLVSSLSNGVADGVDQENDPFHNKDDFDKHDRNANACSQPLFYAQLAGIVLIMVAVFWYSTGIRWSFSGPNHEDSKQKTEMAVAAYRGTKINASSTKTKITVTTTNTTTIESSTATLATSKAHHSQESTVKKCSAQHLRTPSPHKRGQCPTASSSIVAAKDTKQQVSFLQEDTLVYNSSTTSPPPSFGKRKKRRRSSSDSVSSAESDGPPTLISEQQQQQQQQQQQSCAMRFQSQSYTTTPLQSARSPAPDRTTSSVSLPTTPSKTLLHGEIDSFHSSCAELEATQHLAQVFCNKVQVIEEVFAQSGMTSVDRSRVVELALMQQQHEHEHSMRQSQVDATSSGYLQARVPLQKARDECFQATWGAVYHSFWVAVLVEGGRHVMNLVTALDYFSIHELGWFIVQSACGCYEPTLESFHWQSEEASLADEGGQHLSLFSYALSHVSSAMVASSAAASTRYSIDSLIRLTDYLSCFLCYSLVLGCIVLLHTLMQHLRCPAFLHQLVNAGILIAFLAQNPSTWVVVTQNLELYTKWIMVQLMLTSTCLIWIETQYRSARAEILRLEQRQSNLRDTRKQPNNNDRGKINQLVVTGVAEMENLRSLVGIVPPLFLCGWAVVTSGVLISDDAVQ